MKVDTRYNYPIWHDPAISEPHRNERYAPGSVAVHIGQTPGRGMMSSPGARALSRKLVSLFKETRNNKPPEGRAVRTTYLEPGETLRLPGGVSISHFQGNPPYGSSYYDSRSAYSHRNQLKKWISQLRSSPGPHTSVIFTGPQAHWSQGWPAAAWQPIWQPVVLHPMAWPPQPAWPPAWQGEEQRADMPPSYSSYKAGKFRDEQQTHMPSRYSSYKTDKFRDEQRIDEPSLYSPYKTREELQADMPPPYTRYKADY